MWEVVRYLGVPTRPYVPYGAPSARHAIPVEWARQRLHVMRRLLSRDGLAYCGAIPGYVVVLHQMIYHKALYAAPVVDLDPSALEQSVNRHLRSVFVLPPSYPTALLRWELRLMPAPLQITRRALRYVHALVTYSWFYPGLLAELDRPATRHPFRALLFSDGPLHRLTGFLVKYARHLSGRHQGEVVRPALEDPFPLWRLAARTDRETWQKRVDDAIYAEFQAWVARRLIRHAVITYPVDVLLALQDRCRPLYLRQGGCLAHIGLRFKGPSLRLLRSGAAPPACAWCAGPGLETGLHLIECPRLPAHLAAHRFRALSAIACEVEEVSLRSLLRAGWQDRALEQLRCLQWAHQS
jgi:hypothetical protein